MLSTIVKYPLNLFYYFGGFLTLGILYFIIYNLNVVIYRTLKAAGVSKGPDRHFKSPAAVRTDMSLIIDWLYKLADFSDTAMKTGISIINTMWFKAAQNEKQLE